MATFKLNIGNPEDKKTYKAEVSDEQAEALIGLKIGDTVKGDLIGYEGYEFLITGGSDYCGFPMRKDVQGTQRKRILIVRGVGTRQKEKGRRIRKTVAGNTIYDKTAQINLKVIKKGKKPLNPEAEATEETTNEENKEKTEEKKE